MIGWSEFQERAPDIASAGLRLLENGEVAFLATVSKGGRPRVHPFVPRIVRGRLVAFVMDSSPKMGDLQIRRQYSIHMLPGPEDEECFLSGSAENCEEETDFRRVAAAAMGFATGVDEHHVLFEFLLDRALWTRWIDFGTPDHRPKRALWVVSPANPP